MNESTDNNTDSDACIKWIYSPKSDDKISKFNQ